MVGLLGPFAACSRSLRLWRQYQAMTATQPTSVILPPQAMPIIAPVPRTASPSGSEVELGAAVELAVEPIVGACACFLVLLKYLTWQRLSGLGHGTMFRCGWRDSYRR